MQRDDFRMRRWIIVGDNAIQRLGNNFPLVDNDRSEWTSITAPAASVGEIDGAVKECLIHSYN